MHFKHKLTFIYLKHYGKEANLLDKLTKLMINTLVDSFFIRSLSILLLPNLLFLKLLN